MPLSSHFFIESIPENGLAQTTTDSFGPVLNNTFNITSKFQAPNKKAISICRGIVLVQPQTSSSDKANLILRPFTQPFPGLNIKYFIYRGLKKSSFFNGNEIAGLTGASDFVAKIRNNFTDYYDSMGILPNDRPLFLSKFIGFDTATPLDTPISDFFFKESVFVEATPGVYTETDNAAFELPLIDGGKWLGDFGTGDCGIEVVLNNGDYKHEFINKEFVLDLTYARMASAQIIIDSGDSGVEQKLKREQSTQFIDIAAFYGLYIKNGVVSVRDSGGVVTAKTGAAIYTDVINRFTNKNKWYTYIQSDRSRSYNFYESYKLPPTNTNSLKIGVLSNSLNEGNYQTNGWPLIVTETQQSGTNPENQNKLFLQLVTDNNLNTVLYGQVGLLQNAEYTFCNADFLIQVPDSSGVYSNLTNVIELSQPRLPDIDGAIIAGINILLYHGVVYQYQSGTTLDETSTEVPTYDSPNFFDDIFGLIHSKPLMQLNAGTEFSKMAEIKPQLINHYYDKKQQGISAVQTITINDVIAAGVENVNSVARVTYLTEAVAVSTNAVATTGSLATDTKTSPSAGGAVSINRTYVLPEPYFYELKIFTDSGQTIMGIKLVTTNGSAPSKIILGLTKLENDLLKGIVIAQNITNPRLFLLDLFKDGSELISFENLKYQKYKVGVVGEQTDGKLKLFYPPTDVMVYALDRLYHFSKGYSEYMPDLSQFNEFKEIYTII